YCLFDKEEVRAACLLDFGSGCGVKIHVLVEPVAVCFHDGVHAHRIVKPRLDVTGSVRRRAVEVGYTDGDRLYAAFKVRTYGSRKYAELIFVGRFHSDDRIGTEHIRTDIKGGSGTIGRHVAGVCLYGINDSLNES